LILNPNYLLKEKTIFSVNLIFLQNSMAIIVNAIAINIKYYYFNSKNSKKNSNSNSNFSQNNFIAKLQFLLTN
jgi:hypothetical protein